MIKAIFFDFDGTICDTKPDILASYEATFKELNIPIKPESIRIGPPLSACIKEAKPEITKPELTLCLKHFVERYDSCGFPLTSVYNGVIELLEHLKAQNIDLFIATNKRLKPLQLILEKCQLSHYFKALYASDILKESEDRILSKTEMLTLALQEQNIPSANAIMVGDTAGDINAGNQNNMTSIAVLWGYGSEEELTNAQPHFIANTTTKLEINIFQNKY